MEIPFKPSQPVHMLQAGSIHHCCVKFSKKLVCKKKDCVYESRSFSQILSASMDLELRWGKNINIDAVFGRGYLPSVCQEWDRETGRHQRQETIHRHCDPQISSTFQCSTNIWESSPYLLSQHRFVHVITELCFQEKHQANISLIESLRPVWGYVYINQKQNCMAIQVKLYNWFHDVMSHQGLQKDDSKSQTSIFCGLELIFW